MAGLLPFEKEKREVITIREGSTSMLYGKRPEERSVEELLDFGVVNVNKVAGPSSHQVTDYVKRILHLEKAGHSGTLDPKVTGVLPVALGKATRIVQVLLPAGKEYVALMHVHREVSREELEKMVKSFVGEISQLPPVRSAVKRQVRPRRVYYLEILDVVGREVLFCVGCQAGTYIRKLIHDMGAFLGCGAHMVQLVRTKAGPFTDKDWVSLQDVKDAYEFYKQGDESWLKRIIKPYEVGVAHMKKVWVFDRVVSTMCHGASLGVVGVSKAHANIQHGDLVVMMSLKDEIVALGKAVMSSKEMREKVKGLAVVTSKVFMPVEVYGLKSEEAR